MERGWKSLPEVRLELTSRCRDRFLRPARIPFRHSGARLGLRRHDSLDVSLFGEHALGEVQPLLDVGEPPLHVLERVESCLNVFTPPHPLPQLVDRLRHVAPRPPRPAEPIRRSEPSHECLGDRPGYDDEPDAEGPVGNTEHTPPPASPESPAPPQAAAPSSADLPRRRAR